MSEMDFDLFVIGAGSGGVSHSLFNLLFPLDHHCRYSSSSSLL